MVSNKIIYEFCKNFVNKYEEVENSIDEEELNEMNITIEEYLENKCMIEKAGLQALITDDFVKMLPQDLQEEIIFECMKIKMYRWSF